MGETRIDKEYKQAEEKYTSQITKGISELEQGIIQGWGWFSRFIYHVKLNEREKAIYTIGWIDGQDAHLKG